MAPNQAALTDSKQEFWRGVRRDLLSGPSLLFAILCLSADWWTRPAIYFYMWTYKLAPSGLILKSVLVLFAVIFAWIFYSLFSKAVKLGKQVRPYRLAAKEGDQSAIDQLTILRRSKPRPLALFICFSLVILAIPSIVAIIIMDGDQGGLYAIPEHGRLRASTQKEDIEHKLRDFQRRGIYRSVD